MTWSHEIMKIIIAGNNVAGITAAKTIRGMRQDVEIQVFAEEPYHYYPRPILIEFIAGRVEEKNLYFYSEEWYVKNRIRAHLSTPVEIIDPKSHRAFADGKWMDYDAFILATGAKAFIPPIKGLPKKNIFTLRTLDDAKSIKASIEGVDSAVVIGGGLLGLEVARALNQAKPDMKITVLERGEHLLPRQLDHDGANILRALIEEMDIDVFTETEVEEILGSETVEKVKMKDGNVVDAQLVVISAGVRPNTALAEAANLKINRGVVVDDSLCCSMESMVFAIGDVAEHDGRTWGIIPAALDQAKVVARKILGQEDSEYGGTIPSNTLKVMGIDLTSIGIINAPANEDGFEEIRAKSEDGRIYKKFVLKNGKLVGSILLGSRKEIARISKLIREGADISGLKSKMGQIGFDFSGL